MARFIGVHQSSSEAPLNIAIENPFLSLKQLEEVRFQSGHFSMLWVGFAHQEKPVETSEYIFALDGYFYNREEFSCYSSQAEIFFDLWRQFGFGQAVSRLTGDFSLVFYEKKKSCLWLARDHFGIKPLYFSSLNRSLSFSSTPRSLCGLNGVKPTFRQRFLGVFAGSHYRYFDNAPEESPYEGISQVKAAHFLQHQKGVLDHHSYWQLQDNGSFESDIPGLANQYRDLLFSAVKRRQHFARKPLYSLSGGMDSSSVLAVGRAIQGKKLRAVSSVYSDKTYDESLEIQDMLPDNVDRWIAVEVKPNNIFSLIRKLCEIHEEPVATATWLSHYLLCEEIYKLGYDGLFGGLGGDELNAGEYEYFFYFFADLERQKKHAVLKDEIAKWIEYHDHPIFKKSEALVKQALGEWVSFEQVGRTIPDRKRLLRYREYTNCKNFDLNNFSPRIDSPFDSYLKNRTFQDIFFETAPCCLRSLDRVGFYFGIENFLPFFDKALVEFMFQVDGSLKIKHGVTKFLLREAMKGILPDKTRSRVKKTGWNAPAHLWFSGEGAKNVRSILSDPTMANIYDVAKVTQLLIEHDEVVQQKKPVENHMMFLWQLVNLSAFFVKK